jgi:hypothetical protein
MEAWRLKMELWSSVAFSDETYNFFLVKTAFYVAVTGAGAETVFCQKLEREP